MTTRKRLGDVGTTAQLVTKNNKMYTGYIKMGGRTDVNLVFDTGSDWLVVAGSQCDTCKVNDYNPEFSGKSFGRPQSERKYGSAHLNGTEYLDTVCLNDKCVIDFEYFLINEQKGLEKYDGILGLARSFPFYLKLDRHKGKLVGPLFVNELHKNGLISTNAFSFYISDSGGESFVDFGMPNVAVMSDPMDSVDIAMLDDFFWSSYNQAFGFGDVTPANTYTYPGNTMQYSIIDSGTTALLIAEPFFQAYLDKLFEAARVDKYDFIDGTAYSDC
jgi:hypothetical protein